MIINAGVGTSDIERAGRFCDALVAEIGCVRSNRTDPAIYFARPR